MKRIVGKVRLDNGTVTEGLVKAVTIFKYYTAVQSADRLVRANRLYDAVRYAPKIWYAKSFYLNYYKYL